MDFENFKAVGSFIIIKQIEEEEKGTIAIAGEKFPYFGKAQVLASGIPDVSVGKTIIYLKDNAKKFGLGEPNNICVIELDDIVGEESSEAEEESKGV